jgi:3-phosphoshikimate 1-carboxyvinyltransferase
VAITAAPSKSVTHRALVAAALATGDSLVRHPLDAVDTRVTRSGLGSLGIDVVDDAAGWIVRGGGGRIPGGGRLELAESGTSLRFLLAVAALGDRPSSLDGSPRLRERPVAALAAALSRLGGKIVARERAGALPLEAGGAPPPGGRVVVPGTASSQFASALLLVGSSFREGLDLTIEPPAVSLPYVRVTERVLAAFGVVVHADGLHWTVPPGRHEGRDYTVEGDWSSASYPLAAAAITGGCVEVRGLAPGSAQADARAIEVLRSLGCVVDCGVDRVRVRGGAGWPGFRLDLGDAPDLVPTVAALAAFADGPSRIEGVAHLRHKESDRLEAIAANLVALGRSAAVVDDGLEIGAPSGALRGATIRTASDHRIAMAFAVVGLAVPGVVIDDPGCVSKSHPGFWDELARLEGPS